MVEKKLLYNTGEGEAYHSGRSHNCFEVGETTERDGRRPGVGEGGSERESERRGSPCPYSSGVGGDPRRLAAVGVTLRLACRAALRGPLQFKKFPVALAHGMQLLMYWEILFSLRSLPTCPAALRRIPRFC